MDAFEHYSDFTAHLDGLGQFHMDLTLDRVRGVLAGLGLVRPPLAVVQVVGTNGKGSVSRLLVEMAAVHGVSTGLFSSPHLVSVRERIRIHDGVACRRLDRDSWLDLANAVMAAPGAETLTYFELLTVMAVAAFVRADCGLAVLEAGLGGTWDATTAVDKGPEGLALFTSIGLDHTHILGKTLEKIATDKAGAMVPGGRAVSASQEPEAADALSRAAAKTGAVLEFAPSLPDEGDWADFSPGLAGRHQRDNAALALAGWQFLASQLGVVPEAALCREAMSRVGIPGRLHRVSGPPGPPSLLLDGAHNVQAVNALSRHLKDMALVPEALVFTCLADKNPATLVPLARGLCKGPILVPGLPGVPRAVDPGELAALMGPRARAVADPAAALAELRAMNLSEAETALACGSLFLLGELYARNPLWMDEGEDMSLISDKDAPA